ncbi:MAG: hypothetical protein JSV35_02905, partial [Candidatus Bathyarchaeota archaeon]
CTFDEDVYTQGETGEITVIVYNDEETKIQVTELTATIDYFYDDENVYLQTFYSDEILPVEIQPGQLLELTVAFSLPTNIAPGYIEVYVKAVTEQWHQQSESWYYSDHPTYRPVMYVESPYKEEFEAEQWVNAQLQHDLQELQTLNTTTTNIMYFLGLTTVIFAVVTILLFLLTRRVSPIPQPAP